MAGDIKIRWNNDSDVREGDFIFSDNDLETDDGLTTAIIISLYTDRRADDADVLPDENNIDKRGWWGDKVSPDVEGDEIGSKLWLLERAKTTSADAVPTVERYVEESLQWMIDDEAVKSITVNGERLQLKDGTESVGFTIEVTKLDGTKSPFQFNLEWEESYNAVE